VPREVVSDVLANRLPRPPAHAVTCHSGSRTATAARARTILQEFLQDVCVFVCVFPMSADMGRMTQLAAAGLARILLPPESEFVGGGRGRTR